MSDFATVAAAMLDEHYVSLNRADIGRKNAVRDTINNHLVPFMLANGFETGSDVTRTAYLNFLVSLASPTAKSARVKPTRPGAFLTLNETIAETGVSRSTIKRGQGGGLFPKTKKDERGHLLFAHSDLVGAGLCEGPLRTGPRCEEGYETETIADIRRIFDWVLYHGQETVGWVLRFNPEHVKNPISAKPKKAPRAVVTIRDASEIAVHLHAVYQVTLWLIRVLGLRISEAYGVNVDDVYDDGDRGLIRVYRQGGRQFDVRGESGEDTTATSKNTLKNSRSVRVLIVPRQLMVLIRIVIDVFHTDPETGDVLGGNRLVPGLKKANVSGQDAFRTALKEAAMKANVLVGEDAEESLVPPVPHDMRKGNLTELRWSQVDPLVSKRWGGHSPGTDTHHSVYVLDHPEFSPLLPATEAVERLVDEGCPAGLMVPTLIRCTTGVQAALASAADHIDGRLLDYGWLLCPVGEKHETLSDANTVANLLGLHPTKARDWMRKHPEAVLKKGQWFVPLAAVTQEAHGRKARRTLDKIATELGCDYHFLYVRLKRDGLPFEQVGTDLVVHEETEEALRRLVIEQRELESRAVSIPEAAATLGYSTRVVDGLIRDDELEVDDQRGPRNARYVTRVSLQLYGAEHGRAVAS